MVPRLAVLAERTHSVAALSRNKTRLEASRWASRASCRGRSACVTHPMLRCCIRIGRAVLMAKMSMVRWCHRVGRWHGGYPDLRQQATNASMRLLARPVRKPPADLSWNGMHRSRVLNQARALPSQRRVGARAPHQSFSGGSFLGVRPSGYRASGSRLPSMRRFLGTMMVSSITDGG